ncbi:MAG: hypothetical protein A2Y79_07910 [Deltaproteobacteria bacterium RBG_13_43_22]|nr:MAG: hypothetical protein A2Y79_07910 [Deltaproteobacteria bacterium RBG_13_43_22]
MVQNQYRHPTKVEGITVVGGAEIIASTNSGNLNIPFIDRPPQERRSEVAITRSTRYEQAGDAIREAINLLGGIDRFCKKGDVIVIKPNASGAFAKEIADTTHPAVVAATVRLFKEAGTTVIIMERPGFNERASRAYRATGIEAAALDAGADKLWDWEKEEYVEVDVPNPRSFAKVKLPKVLMEADGFIDIPKLKNNPLIGGLTLSVKSKLGLPPVNDRVEIHRSPVEMAAGCCDICKAIDHLHRLTIIDGIHGMDGVTHYGTICSPGIIVASPDLVAVEAVCHTIVGYHPLESPAVQIAMKDGLGTGDLSEIDILGTRIQDVYYPFARAHPRYVQKYTNVKEYFGGICRACLLGMTVVPPVVDPNKKYAVISGRRALVAKELSDFDEVYLVGECACRADHQHPGFMEKVKAAKKIIKLGKCPGHSSVAEHKWGGVYDHYRLIGPDMVACSVLPDAVNPNNLRSAYARREGKVTTL